jgi:hypothetical protein
MGLNYIKVMCKKHTMTKKFDLDSQRTFAQVGEALGSDPFGDQPPLLALEDLALQPGLDAVRHGRDGRRRSNWGGE